MSHSYTSLQFFISQLSHFYCIPNCMIFLYVIK